MTALDPTSTSLSRVIAALAAEAKIVAVAVESLITQAQIVVTPTPEPSQVQQRQWPANETAPGAIGCHPDDQGGTGHVHNKLLSATEKARIWQRTLTTQQFACHGIKG